MDTYIDGMYKTNSDLLAKSTADIPDEQWLQKPGDCSNNLLWIVGHLVWTRTFILKTLGTDVSIPWTEQFGRGKPANIPEPPSIDEVRKAWTDLSEQLATSLATVSADVLDKPHDKPTYDGKVSGFIAFLAFHETYHMGQVSYLRKWLGHGQLMG